ncbi:Uncharacterised protein [Serratia ficaria]|uniref:ABC transporter n=1 Tax=Serratia ficaria TaxID=61651 RepID=UPI00218313D1|nr:ABC transporter [Serratia ficaria]CAI2488895.1 Uncharacterised protein [Serratia ficaria]
MRLFTVWVFLAWKNVLDHLARVAGAIRRLGDRLSGSLLRHVDFHLWLGVRRRLHAAWPLSRRARNRRAVAAANRHSLLGEEDSRPVDFAWLMQRRRLLDLAAVYAHNGPLLEQLARCSARLNRVVEPLHRAGVPVILAPMHTVSDVLAALVGADVYPGRATVIVSGDVQQHFQRAPAHGWRQRLDCCSIHDDQRRVAGKLAQAVLEAADHRRNIILFPDITPDYTLHGNSGPTAKLACRLFHRPAQLHSGIVRLSRALRAQMVCYSLYYDRGIHIRIDEPVAAENIRLALPGLVEQAMVRHADDWLLWHSHSLFFINE